MPERYSFPLFRDADLQNHLARHGYAVAPMLSPAEIGQLTRDARELISLLPEGPPTQFWPSGRAKDPAIRNFAAQAIEKIIPARLAEFFDPEIAEFMGGTFLVKPPGPESELWPHQDSSHVDESKIFAVYAWITLCDTQPENGALHVIPGSHLLGNAHRSLNVPWAFKGLEKTMLQLVKPLNMKAGEVCFFDSATIHYSSVNTSDDYRFALNYFVKPCISPFVHCYMDAQTPPGKVELFSVDIDFFHSGKFEERPPARYPLIEMQDHRPPKFSEEEFIKVLSRY
ncbi:MAG: phytanoyl-CoA dioxygenase family protein [Bacteroidia bacterium]|nr:phytanoyl-CoA dioxygenase family protein [Bacteroidia bacterium]